MTNIFKGKSKEEKKYIRKVMNAMSCELDCDKCKKTQQECIKDIRICLNLLLKNWIKTRKKGKQKKGDLDTMVS